MSQYSLLDDDQRAAVKALRTGSILCGGVGSGKSRVAIAYWLDRFGSDLPPLYVITTAHKRDTYDWNKELAGFMVHDGYTIDSWNNIEKYRKAEGAFFIFDEQRIVGKGNWAKMFLEITRKNDWIVLTATPGDTWLDYVTIFIANNFFKNRTEFYHEHVVFSRVARYPKVERYIDEETLEKLRDYILVPIHYGKRTKRHISLEHVRMDMEKYRRIVRTRFDEDRDEPFADGSALVFGLRRESNLAEGRMEKIREILRKCKRAVIFYNFDYELEILRGLKDEFTVAEWNGHKHEELPKTGRWAYLVQYLAGAEGWECFGTNHMIFYSLHYSYKIMEQACGRIDRRNTKFPDLYYHLVVTNAPIDKHILAALREKKSFNERKFAQNLEAKFRKFPKF